MKHIKMKYGFTLIELLVVVIIIAVLSAVAVPMYKHAALKSRFSTVMPMAKAVADAQEIFYLGRGYYAQKGEEDLLDVAPVSAENTSVTLSKTNGHDYVLATRSGIDANYIIYQQHSENYAGNIYCEAGNEDAEWLCEKNLGGQVQNFSLTPNYKLYLIQGTGIGWPPGYSALLAQVDCAGAEKLGFTCTPSVDEENGTASRKICKDDICVTTIYNEDKSFTRIACKKNVNDICKDEQKAEYDSHGNLLNTRSCAAQDANGTCTDYRFIGKEYTYTYDPETGKLIASTQQSCEPDGDSCYVYPIPGVTDDDLPSKKLTYDEYGNIRTEVYCRYFSSGTCTYNNGSYHKYNEDGTREIERLKCNNETCTTFTTGKSYSYKENENGTTTVTALMCYLENGTCNGVYASGSNVGDVYTYDKDGNLLRVVGCIGESNGECTSYSAGRENAGSVGANSYEYEYDTNGNRILEKRCSAVDSSGECSAYHSITHYTYDDTGKRVYYQTCDKTTGECSESKTAVL